MYVLATNALNVRRVLALSNPKYSPSAKENPLPVARLTGNEGDDGTLNMLVSSRGTIMTVKDAVFNSRHGGKHDP